MSRIVLSYFYKETVTKYYAWLLVTVLLAFSTLSSALDAIFIQISQNVIILINLIVLLVTFHTVSLVQITFYTFVDNTAFPSFSNILTHFNLSCNREFMELIIIIIRRNNYGLFHAGEEATEKSVERAERWRLRVTRKTAQTKKKLMMMMCRL